MRRPPDLTRSLAKRSVGDASAAGADDGAALAVASAVGAEAALAGGASGLSASFGEPQAATRTSTNEETAGKRSVATERRYAKVQDPRRAAGVVVSVTEMKRRSAYNNTPPFRPTTFPPLVPVVVYEAGRLRVLQALTQTVHPPVRGVRNAELGNI